MGRWEAPLDSSAGLLLGEDPLTIKQDKHKQLGEGQQEASGTVFPPWSLLIRKDTAMVSLLFSL